MKKNKRLISINLLLKCETFEPLGAGENINQHATLGKILCINSIYILRLSVYD